MNQQAPRFFEHAFSATQMKNSLKTALLVGALLNIINQWSAVVGNADINILQLFLTFLVPYCVSTYAGAKASMQCAAGTNQH